MRKNKGFTLVELLAVIVILAVIALIATPVVLSMIESSRKGAAESSMLSYTQATENTILTKMMNSSTSVNYDQNYSVVGLTLTSATVAEDGKVTATLPCLDAESTPVAAGEDGKCATGQTVNPAYLAFNIDLKGDQPDANDGNVIKVDDNTVIEAKLKFGKYYVSYFYDKATGTTKYCSDDSAFITDSANCEAE